MYRTPPMKPGGGKERDVRETVVDISSDASYHVRSYDYIRDWHDNVYVVHGIVCDTPEIIVRPISICGATGPEKYNPNIPDRRQKIPYPVYEWGDPDNYVVMLDDIQTIFARDKIPCCKYPQRHKLLSDIVEAISNNNTTTYLFGSRRLDLARPASDLDILVVGNGPRREVVDRVVSSLGGRVRMFNNTECLERAGRYSWPYGYITRQFLIRAFPRTTCYLKTQIGEVGVFFASNSDTVVPRLYTKNKSPHHLRGWIVRSNGSSYLMPRSFIIECPDGSFKEIGTILWSLGGIEECAGEEISLGGLYMVSEERYWLGGADTSVEFI